MKPSLVSNYIILWVHLISLSLRLFYEMNDIEINVRRAKKMLPPHNNILTLIMSVFLFIGIIKYKFLSIRPMEEQRAKGTFIDNSLIKGFVVDFPNHYMISHEKSVPISYNIMLDYLWKKNYGLVLQKWK